MNMTHLTDAMKSLFQDRNFRDFCVGGPIKLPKF